MKKLKLLFAFFPFVPFSGYSVSSAAFALAAAGATLIGFKFLPRFKSKEVEVSSKIVKKLFYVSNPFLFTLELSTTVYFELKHVDWKVEGEKALMVLDVVDTAVGWIPLIGDVVDVADSAAHIVYDYYYDRDALAIDLAFGAIALIPGMSAGATHLGLALVRSRVEIKYGVNFAEKFAKYGKEFHWSFRTAVRVSKVVGEVSKGVKDVDESIQIAYGLYLVSRRSRRYDEILEFSLRNAEKLKFYDGFIHRVLVQASIESKAFRESKLFVEVDDLVSVYGKKAGGLLAMPLGNIKLLRELGKADEFAEVLSDSIFNRFALIRFDSDILLTDPNRALKFVKVVKTVTYQIETAEKVLKSGEFENEIEVVNDLPGAAGVYIQTGKLKFSYWAIYHGESLMEDYMEYLVSHEMMHAIGMKTYYRYIYQFQYHYYSLVYGDEMARIIVNEKMDLLNAKLWERVGNKKYVSQYLHALEIDKSIKIEKGRMILKYRELTDSEMKVRAVFAAEYMAVKGKRYPTDLGEYEKIVDKLLKSFERVLK